jgi:hypothetical protein
MKKTLFNVNVFNKIAKMFSNAMTAQSVPKQGKYNVHLTFYIAWEV